MGPVSTRCLFKYPSTFKFHHKQLLAFPKTCTRYSQGTHSYSSNANSAFQQPARRTWKKPIALVTVGLIGTWYAYECNEIYTGNKSRPKAFGQLELPPSWLAADDAAFKEKSMLELVNSYLVFRLCQVELLVKNAPRLIEICANVGLGPAVNWCLRHTLFRHFCGGEQAGDVVPTMHTLKAGRVNSIVDLSVESDISASGSQDSQELVFDTEELVQGAKSFAAQLKNSIDIASQEPGSFVAVKITGIVPPLLLKKMTDSIIFLRESFHSVASRKALASGVPVTCLDRAEFTQLLEKLPGYQLLSEETQSSLFHAADKDNNGEVDWTDVANMFSFRNPMARQVFADGPIPVYGDKTDVVHFFTQSDWMLLDAAREELFGLCRYAMQQNVKIMIDAEQTYFQAAIDDFACDMEEAFNVAGSPVVYNTYQMYLKDAYYRLMSDYARAQRNGHGFGVKIVRGAYMVAERQRASQYGYPDPIQNVIGDTHSSYHQAVDFCLGKFKSAAQNPTSALDRSVTAIKLADAQGASGATEAQAVANKYGDLSSMPVLDKALSSAEFYKLYQPKTQFDKDLTVTAPAPFGVVIASHNKATIIYAIEKMKAMDIPSASPSIGFAQLLGMQDSVTYSMAANGYNLYKYLPYGDVDKVIPYLIRRAQENSSIMSGAPADIHALGYEIFSRFFPTSQTLHESAVLNICFKFINSAAKPAQSNKY